MHTAWTLGGSACDDGSLIIRILFKNRVYFPEGSCWGDSLRTGGKARPHLKVEASWSRSSFCKVYQGIWRSRGSRQKWWDRWVAREWDDEEGHVIATQQPSRHVNPWPWPAEANPSKVPHGQLKVMFPRWVGKGPPFLLSPRGETLERTNALQT